MRNSATIMMLMLLAGCYGGAESVVSSPGSSFPAGNAAPVADHHLHLVSPTAAEESLPPRLPRVDVPIEVAHLLEQRVERAPDLSAFGKLFIDEPVVLHALYPMWLRGEEALETAQFTPRGVRLVPTAFSARGSAGFVAGTWMSGEGDTAQPVTNFFMYIEKGQDGPWRIVAEGITASPPPLPQPVTAQRIIAEMDAAAIGRGVVLSLGYQHSDPRPENDWVGQQAAEFPDRLIAFCGLNPLSENAIAELERCAEMPSVRGIKVHLGAANVDLRNPEHVETLLRIFTAANDRRLAIVIHLMTRREDYGRIDAEIFLNQILPAATDSTIQIAHLAGAGPRYDADDALTVFAEAASARDHRMRNVYFDVASIVTRDSPQRELELVANRLRQLGLDRILFASDRSSLNDTPQRAWSAFKQLPFSEAEFATVAANLAPYIR